MHIGQAVVAALELEGVPRVVDAEQVHQSCLEVVDVDLVFHDVVAVLVGFAVSEAFLHAAASHPD